MFQLSFLNTSLLFFAAATILPLLIWLLAKKKPQRIVFSTLRFIKLSKQQEKSRSKLKNILLLIIRMLIILLVALAVARPMFSTPKLKQSKKHPPTALALLLDTSYSMDYASDGKSYLQLAKEAVQKINARCNPDDQLVIISSDAAWNLLNSQLYAGAIPSSVLEKISVTYTPLSLAEMLTAAETKLQESQMPNQEIYLLSDYRTDSTELKSKIPLAAIPLGDAESYENLACTHAGPLPQLVEKKRTQQVQFTLENHGNRERKDVLVKAVLGDIKVAERFVTVPPQGTINDVIPIELQEDGWQQGYVEVVDEQQPRDNRAYFAFPFYTRPKIGVITQDTGLPLILDTMIRVYSGSAPLLISPDQLSLAGTEAYQLFVVYDCGTLTPRLRDLLASLAQRKVGVLYLLGDELTADWKSYLNSTFSIALGARGQKPVSIDFFHKHHYITSLISDKQLKHNLSGDFWQAESKTSTTLVAAQGRPLALEADKKLLWLWNINSSNNPVFIDPAFPVLAFRSFDYLANTSVSEQEHKVGETIVADKLQLPDGEMVSSRRQIADKPGVYVLEPGSPRSSMWAVNIDYTDSRARLNKPQGLKYLGTNWEGRLFFSRLGHDLWKTLLLLAFMLVILELIIVKWEESRAGRGLPPQ